MYRDFFTNKWILVCFALLIVSSVSCIIWYRYDTAKDRKALDDAIEYASNLENERKESANKIIGSENNTTVKSSNLLDLEQTFKTSDVVSEADKEKRIDSIDNDLTLSNQRLMDSHVRVSPHGFGPYPSIPMDFPAQDAWDYPDDISAEAELLLRVQIKLWKQGTRTIGGIMKEGLVFPTIPGVVYIEWIDNVLPDGTVEKNALRMRGDPHKGRILMSIKQRNGKLVESDIPPDVKIIELADAGIDPYQFLKLK